MLKKIIVISYFLLTLCCIFSHEPSISLNKGDIGLSYIFYPRNGMDKLSVLYINKETDQITGLTEALKSTAFFSMCGQGDFVTFEYGLFDFLSTGLRIPFFGFLANGIRDNQWSFPASFFVRYNALNKGDIKLHAVSELWCQPLFTNIPVDMPRSKYFVLFNTLSSNWKLGSDEEKQTSLYFFADIKLISTILHPDVKNRDLWLNLWSFTPEEKENIQMNMHGSNRLALSGGLDFTWKKLTMNIALYFPIAAFTKVENQFELFYPAWNIGDFILSNMQLKWMYRF